MAEFKIAEGFVEVEAHIDHNSIRIAAQLAGKTAGNALGSAMQEAADETVDRNRESFWRRMFTPNPGLVRALRTGIPDILGSPIGASGLALGATFAASFIGAVITSGMFALLGAGFTGLAGFALRENEKVAGAWERTGVRISNVLERAAEPMIPAFDQALTSVRGMFNDRLEGPLHKIFAGIAPSIEPMFEGLVETVGRLLDDLATPKFLAGFRTVSESISSNLPRIGDALGGLFTDLADDADDIAEGFDNVVTVVSGLIGFLGDASIAMTDLFNTFADVGNLLAEPADLTDDWLHKLGLAKEESKGFLESARDAFLGFVPFDEMFEAIHGTEEGMEGIGKAAVKGGKGVDYLSSVMREDAAAAAEALEMRLEALQEQADAANEAIKELRDSLFGTAEAALAVDAANDELLDAIDEAKEAVEDKNKVTRQERAALRGVAEASHDVIAAMIDQGASAEDVRDKTETARRKFIEVAEDMGYTSEAANDLADRYGLIPSEVETLVELLGAERAKAKAAEVAAAIANIKSKIVTISINEVHTRIYRNDPQGRGYVFEDHGGIIGGGPQRGMQTGGTSGSLNNIIVGERRPEVVELPFGTRVVPSVEQARGPLDSPNQANSGNVDLEELMRLAIQQSAGLVASLVHQAIDGAVLEIDDRGRARISSRRSNLIRRTE